MGYVKGFFVGVGLLIFAAALAVGGIFAGWASFDSIAAMRRVERIPPSVVEAVMPGEVNLNGVAERLADELVAPHSRRPCLYYRSRIEREVEDSDGGKKWERIGGETKFVDFLLVDDTGRIPLRPDAKVSFGVDQSYSNIVDGAGGKLRHTEWRIDPGQEVFTLGYAVTANDGFEVRFDHKGHYQPIISLRGEAGERLGMAISSVVLCWLGLSLVAFALLVAARVFRLHRLLVYCGLLAVVAMVFLVVLGLNMMRADLGAAAERLSAHEDTARRMIKDELAGVGFAWDGEWASLGDFDQYLIRGLAAERIRRLSRIRVDYAMAVGRVRRQRRSFPEFILAPLWGIPRKAPPPLPESEAALAAELAAGFEAARSPMLFTLLFIFPLAIGALACFYFGFRQVRFKRCVENLPTSPTTGATYGLCEFKGEVAARPDGGEPMAGPLSKRPCVHYRYKVERRERRDKKTVWVTVSDESKSMPFVCKDAAGQILVDPEGAKVMTNRKSFRRERDMRYREERLEIGDPLYAIGECVIDPATGESLYLRRPEDSYPFILSNFTERQVMLDLALNGMTLITVSFSLCLCAALLTLSLNGSFGAADYLAAAMVAPLFIGLVTLVLHYNDLVFLRGRAERNWANIEVSLKKRHDLVPALERVVKAYMQHESGILAAIAEMRSRLGSAAEDVQKAGEFIKSERQAMDQLLGVVEQYPELKADEGTATLTRSLVNLENEIAMMRDGYNSAVETYNTRIQSVPDVFFAKLFSFKDKKFIATG